MLDIDFLEPLLMRNERKIVLVVLDGMGGIPFEEGGWSALEAAATPNMDALARLGVTGLAHPVAPGITPGSGPAHLGLFGYNPLKYEIGRGVLEALGIDQPLTPLDVASRANFATRDESGIIVDRRAGRIPTEKNRELCALLSEHIKKIDDVDVIIRSGKEHRFVVVFRGENLSGEVTDTDPQKEGYPLKPVKPLGPEAERTASIINRFIADANRILADQRPANTFLMRGIAKRPDMPTMEQAFGLTSGAIATYPMYRGLASLVGMDLLPTKESPEDEVVTLEEHFASYDFFFVHFKKPDSKGEDGNFEAKVHAIEEVDALLPRITGLNPDVLMVTCDHSTPARLKSHSWHPIPIVLCADTCRPDKAARFTESECLRGGLGILYSAELMPILLAHALKLKKYGA
jgi:2,3-bisphosphoglycerate-independent phosphoglycerate mutase